MMGVSFSVPPRWFLTTPRSANHYFFAGSFTAKVKSKAINSAKADVIGSILFMINSTVTAQTTFDSVYTRRTGQADQGDSRLFRKIKTRGRAVVSRLRFVRRYFERTRDGKWTAYILARLPRREVDAAIKRVKAMRARLKRIKTACVLVVKYPDGTIAEATTLKSFIEKFYRETLGYNIVEANTDLSQLANMNLGQMTFKLKNLLGGYDQVIFGLVSLTDRPRKRRTTVGGITMVTTSVSGNFALRTVELNSMKIVENNSYYARGVSTRGARDAMNELVTSFKKQLQGAESAADGRDEIFD